MSDTPAMSRPLGGADEFERRMRLIGRPEAAGEDPLAELARLIGQDDPFKGVFGKPGQGAQRERAEPVFAAPGADARAFAAPEFMERSASPASAEDFAAFDHDTAQGFEPAAEHGSLVADHGGIRAGFGALPVEHDEVEQSPDAWAQGEEFGVEPRVSDVPAGSTGRTLIVLAAVAVLTGGGLAASFLAKPSGAVASVGATPPTILAAAGPSKVQPPASPAGDDGQSEPSTLLDKNKNDGTATAKVVNSAEQPVDLSQAVKPAPGAPDASSPFPEPRKVRTVVVRPDGSIAAVDGVLPPAPAAEPSEASLAFDAHTAIPMPDRSTPPAAAVGDDAATSAATPRTPSATTRPRTAATAPAASDGATPASARSKATSIHTRPSSKPVEEASLTTDPDAAAAATAPGAGGFAVQLGAPPNSDEARDTAARLQKKYAAQLGSYRPSIHEAKSGDKSVFRIRVGGLSQDGAKDLCSKLQAAGGACFVARN